MGRLVGVAHLMTGPLTFPFQSDGVVGKFELDPGPDLLAPPGTLKAAYEALCTPPRSE